MHVCVELSIGSCQDVFCIVLFFGTNDVHNSLFEGNLQECLVGSTTLLCK